MKFGVGVKSLMIIILWTAGCVSAAAIALSASGVRVNPIEPISAGVIGAVTGMLGILPLARSGRRDPSSVLQMAMAGTVLHLLGQLVFAGTMIFTHLVNLQGSFVYWLLAEYWISLAALIMQLRRMIVDAIPGAKVKN